MIRAVIIGFNSVFADDETPHLRSFQQTLAEQGLSLMKDAYWGTHLGMDECTCNRDLLRTTMDGKARLVRKYTATHKPAPIPGGVEFLKRAGAQYRLAVATGGQREYIDHTLRGTAIEQDCAVVVSADDVATGKPDPGVSEVGCVWLILFIWSIWFFSFVSCPRMHR